MKFVIFGGALHSSWENDHVALWRGLSRALAQRGHRIVFFERETPDAVAHRDRSECIDGQCRLFTAWEKIRSRAKQELAGADVAIVSSLSIDRAAASDLVCSSKVPMKIFYDLDPLVTLDFARSEPALESIHPGGLRSFDLVLSCTGGRALDELQEGLGARRVAALYPGVDPDEPAVFVADRRFVADLSYFGGNSPDREAALNALLIEPARRLPSRHFLVGGARGTAPAEWPRNVQLVPEAGATLAGGIYFAARLTLALTSPPLKAMGYCPSQSLFLAAAKGQTILSDYWEGLNLFFEIGTEIRVAHGADDVISAIEVSDADLTKMAQRARERVLDEHTMAHRARHLETLIENTLSASAEAELSRAREPGAVPEATLGRADVSPEVGEIPHAHESALDPRRSADDSAG